MTDTADQRHSAIAPDVTLARLLEEHPALLEVFASYHPHFRRLRNPVLRRVMAPRVTVRQAARMVDADPDDLVAVLRQAAGEAQPRAAETVPRATDGPVAPSSEPSPATSRPAEIALAEDQWVRLDVRDMIAQGEEPLPAIMAAVRSLGPEQVLALEAPFEPIPLYQVLGKRGFNHWTERMASGHWCVWFYREAARGAADAADTAPSPEPSRQSDAGAPRVRVLDVRGLEPPQPMVRVLETLDHMPADAQLHVIHDRRPLFLYPQLEERGFAHETDEPEPGVVRIVIARRDRP